MEDIKIQESIERLIQAYQALKEQVEEAIAQLQKIV
jgi:molybdenum-dependent DNA-binding transcriptional regulator ModE